MTWWREGFTDTIAYALPSGVGDSGDLTYAAPVTDVAARVHRVSDKVTSVDDEELLISHKIQTEAPLTMDARVWLTSLGATSGVLADALLVYDLEQASDLETGDMLTEVSCG